jgi:hypothetical protein
MEKNNNGGGAMTRFMARSHRKVSPFPAFLFLQLRALWGEASGRVSRTELSSRRGIKSIAKLGKLGLLRNPDEPRGAGVTLRVFTKRIGRMKGVLTARGIDVGPERRIVKERAILR